MRDYDWRRGERLGLHDCYWRRQCGVVRHGVGNMNERGIEDCYLVGDEDCHFVGGCDCDEFGTLRGARGEGYGWVHQIYHGRVG